MFNSDMKTLLNDQAGALSIKEAWGTYFRLSSQAGAWLYPPEGRAQVTSLAMIVNGPSTFYELFLSFIQDALAKLHECPSLRVSPY